MIITIFGETRERVAELYELLTPPEGGRVRWQLADTFTAPVGHACFAPDHPDIEEAYRERKLRALKATEPAETPKPKKKARKRKPATD